LSRAADIAPVDWSLWRRVRFFGGIGVVCAFLAIGLELLIADIPNGRAFSRFSSAGAPLWPLIWFVGLWTSASGLAVALLLPLYRWRHGGKVIGLAVSSLAVPADLMTPREPPSVGSSFALWQLVVVSLAWATMAASLADSMRDSALGRQGEAEPQPPVT
jgi:hypothetical protein